MRFPEGASQKNCTRYVHLVVADFRGIFRGLWIGLPVSEPKLRFHGWMDDKASVIRVPISRGQKVSSSTA
jgi:hypothetical protein